MSSPLAIALVAAVLASIGFGLWSGRRPFVTAAIGVAVLTVLAWLLAGPGAVRAVAVAALVIVVAVAVAAVLKAALLYVLPAPAASVLRTAPVATVLGMAVILVYVVVSVLAPVMAPYGEAEVVGAPYLPPGGEHLLGTDQIGRDLLSRLIYGGRNTIGIAFATTALAFLLGALTGLFAATVGGWVDQVVSRLVDVLMAIPPLIFALLILTIIGPSVLNLIIVIALLDSTRVFRLVRAVAGNIVVMDYVEAARLRGESTLYLITREVLPNAVAPLVAEFGLRFCFVFLTIAALSFLGLGIQPPTADWGSMVRENATLISFGLTTPLIPAAAIALLTVSVNLVVDWMLNRYAGLRTES